MATAVSTGVQHASSLSRFAVIADKFIAIGAGYEWVSVIDGKTSAQCRALDGRRFDYGKGPLPPIHPNCRSHTVPFFKNKTAFLRGLLRRAGDGAIAAGETYYTWLQRQPKKFQIDVLGVARARAFRSGKISAKEFARLQLDKNFRPITLEELRTKKPELFDDED